MLEGAKIFEPLADYPVIFVVGPQRSGTRIAAKMAASDTKHEYVDEVQYYIDSLSHLWHLLYQKKKGKKLVVQGPGITPFIHDVVRKGECVVFMKRKLDEIIASQKRINWVYNLAEIWKLRASTPSANGSVESAALKLANWDKWQEKACARKGAVCLTVNYDDLVQHPMWKPKDERGHFKWNQVR